MQNQLTFFMMMLLHSPLLQMILKLMTRRCTKKYQLYEAATERQDIAKKIEDKSNGCNR